jgi:hypothetical protein
MLNLPGFDSDFRAGTLSRAQTFALEHLVAIHCTSNDLRWALAELIVRSIAALLAAGHKRLSSWSRRLARRLRSASAIAPADTMVAAGAR